MLNNAKCMLTICSNCPRRRSGICKALQKTVHSNLNTLTTQPVVVRNKKHLFRQNDPMHETYILKNGLMLLYRITEEGKRWVFPPVLPGEIIGIHKDKNTLSPFSAISLQDSVVCKVSQFNSLCLNDPNLGMVLSALYEYESVKNEMYLANIAHSDAKHRVAFLVLELFRRFELKDLNKGLTIPFPLKQADLGEMLGLSTVHVCRTLDILKEESLLEIHQQTLTILDYPRLYSFVDEYLDPIIDCDIDSMPGSVVSEFNKMKIN